MNKDYSGLKRPKSPMPGFVKQALKKQDLMEAYLKRPAYQQEGYLDWIEDAKIQGAKLVRLKQMLDELTKGGIYMNEKYPLSEQKEN